MVFQVWSEGGDRLSKRNEDKFQLLTIEEEEECRLLYSSNVGKKECVQSENQSYLKAYSEAVRIEFFCLY